MSNHLKPTIGRIVYYRGDDSSTRAAIVTGVNGDFNLDLFVFPRDSQDSGGSRSSVTHADPDQEPGCFPSWHWMPYQKEQAAKQMEAASATIGGTVGHMDDAIQREYMQRHQREAAMHMAISSRQANDGTREVLEAAAQFLAFMKGEAQ